MSPRRHENGKLEGGENGLNWYISTPKEECFWTTNHISNAESEDGGKILGTDLDCSTGRDIFSRLTPGKREAAGVLGRNKEGERYRKSKSK